MMTIGYVSDSYLQNYFEKSTKNKFHNVFQEISVQLKLIEKDILENINFVSENDEIIASLNLINNYENIDDYNKILFDEEKKRILKNIDIGVKYSLANHISVYDANYKLVAYIDKERKVDLKGFVSYKDSKPIHYYKNGSSKEYLIGDNPAHFESTTTPSFENINHKLQRNGVIYEKNDENLILKSDIAILRTFSDNESKIVGYVTANNIISKQKINLLLNNNIDNLILDYNFNSDSQSNSDYNDLVNMDESPILFSTYISDELYLGENKNNYYSSVNVALNNDFLSITAIMEKTEINNILNKSQNLLIITLISIILITLMISLIVLKKLISDPFNILLNGIKEISDGDYSKQIHLHSNDELGTISKEFNKMAKKIAKREKELDELAYNDLLTKMPNRMMFNKQLDMAMGRAKRNNNNLAVLFLDIDEFKTINDTLGHHVGDKLLIKVAKRLSDSMRMNDVVARIGGDEFNILIQDFDTEISIEDIAKKIISKIKEPLIIDGNSMSITISIGVAIFPFDGKDSTTILKNADLAMYHAKESGRNQHKFFSKKLEEILHTRTVMLKELKKALIRNELKLYYQPKFSLQDGSIKTVEALIRWENKELGFVMPDQFIPLAESSGEIIKIGAWIMQQACDDLASMQILSLPIKQVSVNVSNKQFADGNIVELIQSCLDNSKLPPTSLEIEMTESYIHDNSDQAIEVLHQIRALGIDLAIDDFGTGYSSMSYLKKLPLSRLKIDKSFIDDIPHSSDDVEITKVIVALAKVLGLKITAEGIETTEQMKFLEELECDEGQGYICSRPVPYEELVVLLKNGHCCKH